MAAARAAGRGRPRGGVPGRTGLAQRSQTTPPAIILARARDATSTPGARARATPGGVPAPPPKRLQGGGTQLKRLRYVKPAGRAQEALPALPAPPSGSHRARGGTRSPSATRASRTPGRTRTGGGGSAASPPPLPPLPGAGGHFRGHLTPADGGSGGVISQRGGRRPPPGGREPPPRGGAGSGGFGRTSPKSFGGRRAGGGGGRGGPLRGGTGDVD